ncbi:EF-hand calcium-binding domain protein [Apiospora saccharicola]|uniref:EF-hand calcium-binding domain protein n=1 Tax=Apiospora saccharicola TaxID=335842 RepID=A0ABR1U3T0_9PEZI
MKFLCLHGAYGSAKNFQAQLGPFVDEVKGRDEYGFVWIDGIHETTPPDGFQDYFGAAPWHRHVKFEASNFLKRMRQFPQEQSAEDSMRYLLAGEQVIPAVSLTEALDRVFQILEDDPEIKGLIGYSEGCMIAASLIIEEQRRRKEHGTRRRIERAIFFAGWPPMTVADGQAQVVLSDASDAYIDIPTFHVIGCNDPYLNGSMSLYTTCDEDYAEMFDHGQGHTVPRDPRTMKELVTVLDKFLDRNQDFRFEDN